MKICVCIKQVPSREAPIYLDENKTWLSEADSRWETNEADQYALEQALQIKDGSDAEVLVICLGPERVHQSIKEALAKGADRAVHIHTDKDHSLDALQIATAMAKVLGEEKCDLIFTGLQSDDQGFAQTGVVLAEKLAYPHASIIIDMQLNDRQVRVKRELEAGWSQWMSMDMPCVLTVQSGMNKPRYANMKGILAAKKKPLVKIQLHEVLPAELPVSQRIEEIFVPRITKQTEMLSGDDKHMAETLIQKLNLN